MGRDVYRYYNPPLPSAKSHLPHRRVAKNLYPGGGQVALPLRFCFTPIGRSSQICRLMALLTLDGQPARNCTHTTTTVLSLQRPPLGNTRPLTDIFAPSGGGALPYRKDRKQVGAGLEGQEPVRFVQQDHHAAHQLLLQFDLLLRHLSSAHT